MDRLLEYINRSQTHECGNWDWGHTEKKENQIFLIYKGSQKSHIRLTASTNMVKYLRISSYIRKPFLIYDFATDLTWISLYMMKISLSFLSVHAVSFLWAHKSDFLCSVLAVRENLVINNDLYCGGSTTPVDPTWCGAGVRADHSPRRSEQLGRLNKNSLQLCNDSEYNFFFRKIRQ